MSITEVYYSLVTRPMGLAKQPVQPCQDGHVFHGGHIRRNLYTYVCTTPARVSFIKYHKGPYWSVDGVPSSHHNVFFSLHVPIYVRM